MTKRPIRRGIVITLILTMILPLFLNINSYAKSKVVDSFYVLDEEGNPVIIEMTQEDLDNASQEDHTYSVVASNTEETTIIGEYDDLQEASDSYNETIDFFQSMSMFTAEESSVDVTIIDNTEDVISTTEDIIGVVRFDKGSSTFDYIEVETGRKGYLSPYSTGDAAYIRTEGDYVICKVSGVTIKVHIDAVDKIQSYEEDIVSYYRAVNGFLVHTAAYYSKTVLTSSSTRVGYFPSYLDASKNYYSYDGHYFYESFETMIGDYRNDSYEHAVNASNPYYNYYQYLSFHTAAGFTGDEYNNYITSNKSGSVLAAAGDDFVNTQNKYIINALLMFGIAINESGWGLSDLATTKNNLFGLRAVDSNPYESGDTFSSVAACIEDFAYGWMHTGYLKGTDFRYRGPHLGNKHSGINVMYASDPYWGEKGAARPYYFDTDKEDYGRYTIGIATSGIIKLYKEADTSSNVLYTSESGSDGNLYDYPVTILDTVKDSSGNTFYKVVSDMSLLDDRSARNATDIYKPSRDYVYARAEDVKIVFTGSGKDLIIPDPEEDPEEGGETAVPAKTQEEVLSHINVTNTSGYLTGFELGGDISTIISKIKALSDTILVVAKDKNGTQITSGTLATGMTLAVTTDGSTVTYHVVIRGDVSGDGKISAIDYVKVRNYLDGATKLSGAYVKAADASGDGRVSALDYVKVRNHLDKKSRITQ